MICQIRIHRLVYYQTFIAALHEESFTCNSEMPRQSKADRVCTFSGPLISLPGRDEVG